MYEFISLIGVDGITLFIMGGSALMMAITMIMIVMVMIGDNREVKEAPADVFPMPSEEEDMGIQLLVDTYHIGDEVPEYIHVHEHKRDATVMEGEPVEDWRFALPSNKQEAWAMNTLGLALTRKLQMAGIVCVGMLLAVTLPVFEMMDNIMEMPGRIADLEHMQDKQDLQAREDISILTEQSIEDERLIYRLNQRLARLEAKGLPDIAIDDDDDIIVFI